MEQVSNLFKLYFPFIIIMIVFIILFLIFMKVITKIGGKTSYYIHGFFANMKDNYIFAFVLIIINFIFLGYNLVLKINLNYGIVLVSEFLILIAFTIVQNFKYLIIGGLINLVNVLLLYIGFLIQNLRETGGVLEYILQICFNVFGLFFYIVICLLFLKNIYRKEDTNGKDNG